MDVCGIGKRRNWVEKRGLQALRKILRGQSAKDRKDTFKHGLPVAQLGALQVDEVDGQLIENISMKLFLYAI